MLAEVVVRALEPGLVAIRDDDAALELVAHEGRGDAAEEGEDALVAGDPVRDLLGRRGVDVLVLDDWGLTPATDQRRRDLLEILEDR